MKTGRGRGFNAAKKGSGQVGFQSAPPVHPEVPSAIDWAEELLELQEEESQDSDSLDTVYAQYSTLIQRNMDASLEGLSEEEKDIVLAAREQIQLDDNSEVAWSPETRYAAQGLLKELGFTSEEEKNILEQFSPADIPKQVNYYEYMPSEDAEQTLRDLLEGPPFFTLSSEETILLDKVRSGEVMLTRHDLDYLTALRNHAYNAYLENHSLDERRMLEAEWIPTQVSRKCEMCGKFIGTRDSHGRVRYEDGSDSRNYECSPPNYHYGSKVAILSRTIDQLEEPSEYNNYKSLIKTTSIVSDEDVVSEYFPHEKIKLPRVNKKFVLEENDFSPEFLEDAYMYAEALRPSIVSLYVEKRNILGRDKKVVLPQNIRDAVVEAPCLHWHQYSFVEDSDIAVNSMIVSLAAKIEPPFNRDEVKRMIDRGDASTLAALLATKKTRDLAIEAVGNYPSRALRELSSSKDGLSSDVLDSMVTSGDPKVRSYAAGSPNLSTEDAIRLAQDPDPTVRSSLAHGSIKNHKEHVGEMLINDSNPEVAFAAFEGMRPEKQTVTSFDEKYPYNDIEEVSYRFSQDQKYLISKIRSRRRFNELKQYIIQYEEKRYSENLKYNFKDPEIQRFLAH